MKSQLVQFSTVVVGDSHNPTILNPDFLAMQGIVPKSWGWALAETLTTPPLAMVRYTNGVSITVEQSKLQITDPNVQDGPEQSRITDIAAAYIEILPHVKYTAVGNNFSCLIPMPEPGDYLKQRFICDGPWNNSPSVLDTVGVKLSYLLSEAGRLTFAIDAAEARLPDNADPQQVVVCHANFSRECRSHPASSEAVQHLRLATQDWITFRASLNTLFEVPAR